MIRSRSKPLAHAAVVVTVCLLAACADEEAGPQFATDPRPTRPPTEAAASPAPALLPTAASIATPASFADLLSVRGAASAVFIVSGNGVWSISSGGEPELLFEAPDGATIHAIDPSPDARSVAILLETTTEQGRVSQVVLADAGGSPTTSLEMSGSAQATPGAEDIEVPRSVDWSPQGDRILAQLHSGQIFQIETRTGATPVELDVSDVSGRIITPAWSPTGQDIAYIAESDDGATRSLGILDVQTGETAIVVAPQQGRLVVDFAWLPDGVSLLFTEGGVPGSAITGIDLWRVDANGENRALVASAGTVAPVARIANLSPSPDGRSVAYAVLVPGRAAPVLDSVWVRNLESGVGFRIPVPSVASLEQIWWTDEGLVISVVTQGTPGGRSSTQALLQVSSDGTMSALWAAPTAAATPTSATPAGERGST